MAEASKFLPPWSNDYFESVGPFRFKSLMRGDRFALPNQKHATDGCGDWISAVIRANANQLRCMGTMKKGY